MKVVVAGEGEENHAPAPLADEEEEQGVEVIQPVIGGFTQEYLETMNQVLAQQPLSAVLEWCCKSLPNFYQVTSFGSAGMVVIHELHKLNLSVPSIFLNTLYHFEETLEHARAVEKQYNITVHWYRCPKAATREEFEKVFKSNDMWISHPRRYEYLTKVEPLERALEELKVSAWITGRRRDQGGLRTDLPILELDVDGRIKVNPLAHWTREEVWNYLNREGVPYNPLFDKSYASIGDSVTTAQTADLSQGERSGRFYQFDGKKTECGIHIRRAPAQAPAHDIPLPNLENLAISSKGLTTN
eukprot:Phypoly_transcript_11688.p1 GENE.Phypoly_transcript_11688~~Phypoly_transcript_11688.p1  ORF type:complete len:300 (-),score=55.14 Phypoly_transcript_11688:224-1123(-)